MRLAGGRPVLGVCVGMQVLFDGSTEPAAHPQRARPRRVARDGAAARRPGRPAHGVVARAGGAGSRLFAGVEDQRFYFVHSYAVQQWSLEVTAWSIRPAVAPRGLVVRRTAADFVAAVENGPLVATQFHPEKSGDAGAHLLENWVRSL